ncbi:MAG: excinuclease ABC subunit UvrC [Spirochaetaceae bacterium]|jgi:excinuclease ABC subunit C|nr:excinuclease ABC subunit UvrC [Spirochaetaceae bacterium]
MNAAAKTIREQAAQAPLENGCYIMRGADGGILYVGKAKALRHRLASYFAASRDVKTVMLMRQVCSIETIIVSNEYEALLLENTLIKQHKPKYNIDLKDGKSYPVIRRTAGAFPKIIKTRVIVEDGSKYFGPFPNSQAVDKLLGVLKKIYPTRKCKILRRREYPCLYFHIGQCGAPCCGKIGEPEYMRYIEKIEAFLSGDTAALVVELTANMHDAAREFLYEKAARFRDALEAANELCSANAVVDFDEESRDYIAFAGEGLLTTWSVFSMRGGRLTGRELYRTKNAADDNESIETFCVVFYSRQRPPPATIFIQKGRERFKSAELKRYFKDEFGYTPVIKTPAEKRHLAALAMARQNALEDLRKRLKERGMGPVLDELRSALNLRRRPARIEGFDIAQLDGRHPVASLVSFYNGVPDKKNYRTFKLKSVIGKVDDFAAMREAVRRRYARLAREGGALADFILIDGGIGQVNAAKAVLDELGVEADVAGLAKRNEELWLPAALGETAKPVILPKTAEALKLLQAVRDETHRVATSLNQKLRSKALTLRSLESIEGIGPVRARRILTRFVSLRNIAAAGTGEIAVRGGISEELAGMVKAVAAIELENKDKGCVG